MANVDLYSIAIKDNASLKIDGISKKLQSMTQSLLKQKMATQLSADALVRWEAKLAGAGPFQVMQIYQLQRQVQAHKEKQAAEAQALAATVSAQKMEAQVRSQQLQSTISSIDRAAAAQRKAQQADMQAKASVDRLVASLRDEAATYGMTKDQIELYKLEQAGATQAQVQSVRAAQIYRSEQIKGIEASKGVTKHLRFMRGGFGQVGHQLQDIAVQAQMGTNGMIIFGQQGSQIASLFGPGGAMIGAVLAVGAALSTVLVPSLFKAGEAMKKIKEEQKTLIDTFNQFDGVLKAFGLKAASDEIKSYDEVIKDSTESLDKYNKTKERLNKIAGTIAGSSRREDIEYLHELNRNLSDLNVEIMQEGVTLALAEKQRMQLILATQGFTIASQDLIEKLTLEIATFGMSEVELAKFEAAQSGASEAVQVTIEALTSEADSLKKKKKADEAAAQAVKDNQQAVEDMISSLDEEIRMFDKSAVEIAVRAAELRNATNEEIEAIRVKAQAKQALIDKKKIDDEALQAEIDRTQSLGEMIEALQEEAATMLLSARNLAIYNAGKVGATTADIERINTIYDEIDAQLELQKVRDKAAEAKKDPVEEFEKIREQMDAEKETPAQKIAREQQEAIDAAKNYAAIKLENQIAADQMILDAETIFAEKRKKLNEEIAQSQLAATSSVISSFQTQISAMAGFVDEGSALGKAFYLAQQAMAAGMAIIKGYEAASTITAAMALMGPTGIAMAPAMASAAIAMGYVNAAMIAGQTFASFEGGGHVGGRSRSGGMDNKGGVLAMLHPNESVIDHTKGQSGGVTIINNIDASGAGPEVDIKIEQAMNRSSAMTVAKIQDLMSRRRFA